MVCRPEKIATAQCLSCPNYGSPICPLFSEGKTSSMQVKEVPKSHQDQ